MPVLPTSRYTKAQRAVAREAASVVYFIEAVGLNLIKIGYAMDLRLRFTGMMTASPAALTLHGVIPGGPKVEMEIHDRLAEHRAHGEWFHKTPAVMAEVAKAQPSEGQEWLNQKAKIRGAALQQYLAKMKAGEVIRPTRGPSKHPGKKRKPTLEERYQWAAEGPLASLK